MATAVFEEPGARRAVVFSHPNHEITLYGFLKRQRPQIVYLTDGGGEPRLEQTREGLAAIQCLEGATFLNHSEASFYDALLEKDVPFYRRVADQVRAALAPVLPAHVLCDAVEFCDPVHDMTLPVVLGALSDRNDVEIHQVPLVWERREKADSYVLQRVPPSRRAAAAVLRLTDEEIEAKDRARTHTYMMLCEQMGSLFGDAPRSQLEVEEAEQWRGRFPGPDGDASLCYERRGRRALEKGEISRAITYADHWLPVATALV